MNANTFSLKSFVKDTIKDLERSDARLRLKAARHVQEKVIQKITARQSEYVGFNKYRGSAPGQAPGEFTGNLAKGIKVRGEQYSAIVGAVAPAYHATLLEFGTRSRVNPRTGKLNNMAARPFLYPTFEEESGAIKEILSEARV
jgi:hypothetical protein